MRELHLRAWHKTKKAMMLFELSELNDSMITKPDDGWYLEDCELSESIDMKDKHDTQAFMGDIVWFGKYDPDTGKKITYVIDYQSFCYGLVPRETYIDLEYCGGAFEMLRYRFPVKMEIIGNIWETGQ